MSGGPAYRIPPGVEFLRWREGGPAGTGEWVVYHSGTGETLRLSEPALTLLDTLLDGRPRDGAQLATTLTDLIDGPVPAEELAAALDGLLRALLRHECIEALPCD
jgi:hypothetical protein